MNAGDQLDIYVFTAPRELAGTVVPFQDAEKLLSTGQVMLDSGEPGNVMKWGSGKKWILMAKAREELSSRHDCPDAVANAFRQLCARNVLEWIYEQDLADDQHRYSEEES